MSTYYYCSFDQINAEVLLTSNFEQQCIVELKSENTCYI